MKNLFFSAILTIVSFFSFAETEDSSKVSLLESENLKCSQTTTTSTTTNTDGSSTSTTTVVVSCDTPGELVAFIKASKE